MSLDEEYIQRILHKDCEVSEYSFYAKITNTDDVKNEDLMEELFGNDLYFPLDEIDDEFRIYINFNHGDVDEYLLELDVYIYGDHHMSYFIDRINSKEKLIEMIKRIGKYYHWQDNEEVFIENTERKQKTLFSLLYFHKKLEM